MIQIGWVVTNEGKIGKLYRRMDGKVIMEVEAILENRNRYFLREKS